MLWKCMAGRSWTGLVQEWSYTAFSLAEVAITRAFGQAVLVPGSLYPDNFDRHAQILNHFANDGELLEIFLAEH